MSTTTPSTVSPLRSGPFHLVVGTFNDPSLHVLNFSPPATLTRDALLPAVGNHSWLALDQPRNRIYATSWTANDADAAVIAYELTPPASPEQPWDLQVLGSQLIQSRSGYTALGPLLESDAPPAVLYTVGGPTGEVFRLDPSTGKFAEGDPAAIKDIKGSAARWQELDFITGRVSTPGQPLPPYPAAGGAGDGPGGQHTGTLAFGGLRNGSHSVDLGPLGPLGGFEHLRPVYVADIGRNCTWVYTTPITGPNAGSLTFSQRAMAPLQGAGPRHVWPHPNGRVVYVLEEHACTIDVYSVSWNTSALPETKGRKLGIDPAKPESGPSNIVNLTHVESVRIIPTSEDPKKYWADEVRLSPGSKPTYLFGSTRGLEAATKGWLALFALDRETGLVLDPRGAKQGQPLPELQAPQTGEALSDDTIVLDFFQTPTSGGWANAIEPSPWYATPPDGKGSNASPGDIYAALTDSEQGMVMVIKVDAAGQPGSAKFVEVARYSLGKNAQGQIRGAATAVWLA